MIDFVLPFCVLFSDLSHLSSEVVVDFESTSKSEGIGDIALASGLVSKSHPMSLQILFELALESNFVGDQTEVAVMGTDALSRREFAALFGTITRIGISLEQQGKYWLVYLVNKIENE